MSKKGILRRLRGIVGTGLIWAVGWAGINLGLGVAVILMGTPLGNLSPIVLAGIIQGFFAGSAFAVILSITERRHALDELSLQRVALWGGIGGMILLLPAIPFLVPIGSPMNTILVPLVIDGLIGAGFASGSVALARRGDKELTEGEDPALMLEGD